MQVAGLCRADEGMGVGHEIALNFNLGIVERAVDDLRLEGHAGAAFPPVVEAHAAFHPDFAFGNGIGVFHPDRPVRVEIVVIQGEAAQGQQPEQEHDHRADGMPHRPLQWGCSRSLTIIGLVASALAR